MDALYSLCGILNAWRTCPRKCRVGQADRGGAGGGGVVKDTTNPGALRVGLWVELHSKENHCIVRLQILRMCGPLPTTRIFFGSRDEHVWPICALTTLVHARDLT